MYYSMHIKTNNVGFTLGRSDVIKGRNYTTDTNRPVARHPEGVVGGKSYLDGEPTYEDG